MTEVRGEPITPEGLAALETEIAELEGPGRTAMAERIKAARELGDLKENAEYHIAKDDQAHLETRIKRLRAKLRDAVVVDPVEVSALVVAGSVTVVVSVTVADSSSPQAASARPASASTSASRVVASGSRRRGRVTGHKIVRLGALRAGPVRSGTVRG